MVRKLKLSSLSEFSSWLVRFFGFPNGTEIRLYRKKTGRRIRSDFTVKRKAINSSNLTKLPNSSNVRAFLDEALSVLSTDIEARGLEMQLFAPDGGRLNGNMLLGKVRKLEPNVSEDSDEVLDTFIALLENCGLDDINLHQAWRLYNQLDKILDKHLSVSLVKNASNIMADSL